MATSGSDPLGRHSWNASALWRAGADAPGTPATNRAQPDWTLTYQYDRWRPVLYGTASDTTKTVTASAPHPGLPPIPAVLGERDLELGAYVPFRTLRRAQLLQTALVLERHTFSPAAGEISVYRRNAWRGAWSFNNSKTYDYSISPEQGVAGAVTGEVVRRGLGATGDAEAFTVVAMRSLPRGWERAGRRAIRSCAGSSISAVPAGTLRSSTSAATHSACCADSIVCSRDAA
jgi:hypothetical protein